MYMCGIGLVEFYLGPLELQMCIIFYLLDSTFIEP